MTSEVYDLRGDHPHLRQYAKRVFPFFPLFVPWKGDTLSKFFFCLALVVVKPELGLLRSEAPSAFSWVGWGGGRVLLGFRPSASGEEGAGRRAFQTQPGGSPHREEESKAPAAELPAPRLPQGGACPEKQRSPSWSQALGLPSVQGLEGQFCTQTHFC